MAFSAILFPMSKPTDDRPRTQVPIARVQDSQLAPSSGTKPELEDTEGSEKTTESFRGLFSSHQRGGRWEAADEIHVSALFGEVVLDFTRAELPPGGEVEIEAFTVCGEVRIIVPEDAEIDVEGEPFLGSIEHSVQKKSTGQRIREWVTGEDEDDLPTRRPEDDPPYFRIDARAILGSIKIMTSR